MLGVVTVLAMTVGMSGSALASAHHVGIAAIPNPIDASDSVVIVGHLSGSPNANQRVDLFRRLAGQRGFSFVQTVRTDSHYAMTRKAGVVDTNRA